MPSSLPAPRPARAELSTLVTTAALGLLSGAGAAFVSTQVWETWFSHPGQQRPELTHQGALLWRIMLGVTAVMMIFATVTWIVLGRYWPEKCSPEPPLSREQPGVRPWGLVVIVVMALGLRAWRINESLWYDEIASWMTYSGGATTLGAVIGNSFDPINHPFHTLLNHLSVKWFTDSLGVEMAFRLPALLVSLMSVVAIYGLARSSAGERLALIAAGLAAVLPVSVLEGVEARGYSMMICFAAASSWLLIEARRSGRSWMWATYALICALGVWAHFVTALAPIGHGVWLAWRGARYCEWREAAHGAMALTLAATLAITLYSPMLPGMFAARGMFTAISMSQPTILGPEGLHALLQMGGSWYWWAAIPGLILLCVGLIVVALKFRTEESRKTASMAVEISLIGLPLMLILVALSGTWVYARFMLFALPGAILLIALGIDALWKWRAATGWMALGLIAVASIADLALRPPKQPLRDAADYIDANLSPQDRIVVVGLAHEVMRLYAYDLNLTYSFRHGADLSQKLQRVQPRWIVVEYPRSVQPEVYQLIERAGFIRAAHFDGWVDWTNGDIIVYEIRK